MELTRVDRSGLAAALLLAKSKIDEAAAVLYPYLVVLTENDRYYMPRTRDGFPSAARSLCRAAKEHPGLVVGDFDPEAVEEDLDNVAALEEVSEKLGEFSRRLADSRLSWLAEAYSGSLSAYGIAKILARSNGALRTVIEPLSRIFAGTRSLRGEAVAARAK